jgi:hypothetical protein
MKAAAMAAMLLPVLDCMEFPLPNLCALRNFERLAPQYVTSPTACVMPMRGLSFGFSSAWRHPGREAPRRGAVKHQYATD